MQASVEQGQREERHEKRRDGRKQGGDPRGRADHDQDRRRDWTENDEKEKHQRKTAK
jgi:hypothetical protein